jgi:uncharacterized protein
LKKLFSLFFIGLLFFNFLPASAQDIPARPKPPRLVNDFTQTLTPDQIEALEKKLVVFDDSTSTQVAVVIMGSLNGLEVSDMALKIGRSWGVGGKEYNNGVVFLVAINDRRMNISTGYGVEGALPDITAKHIIEEVVTPNFKQKNYYRGIDEGTDAIIKAVKGEYKAPPKKKNGGSPLVGFLIFVTIILIFIFSGAGRQGQYVSRRGSRGFMGPMFFPGGGWGGGSSGSSGGGGFGGFGGGSFGGGGASGGW